MDYDPRQQRQRPGWRGFTFFGGSSEQSARPSDLTAGSAPGLASTEAGGSFLLSEAQPGDRVWIVAITAEAGLLERLISMGLNRGTELEVINRGAGGSIMIGLANTRLGLGLGMAAKIRVQRSGISMSQTPGRSTEIRIEKDIQEESMQTQIYLRDLAVGSQGHVTGYNPGSASYRQKLLAMGLTPGTEFTITRQAPLGDPVELRVRGFQLSLRKAEADALIVEAINHA